MKNERILRQFIDYKKQFCTKASVDQVRRTLEEFLCYLPCNKSLTLNKNVQYNYVEKIMNRNKFSTVYKKVNHVKEFYSFCVEKNLVAINPFERMNLIDKKKLSTDILYEPELDCLFEKLDRKSCLNFQEHFLFEMFVATLGKTKEILNLKMNGVLFEDGNLFFHTHGNHYFFSNAFICEKWYDYIKYRTERVYINNQKHNYILVTDCGKPATVYLVKKVFDKVSDEYDVSLTPLKLRRSLMVYLLNKGVDVRILQLIVGHNSIQSAGRYEVLEFERLKDVVNRYLPRGRDL